MSLELKHDHLTRQLDIIPIDRLGQKVTIIGCGAVGSFLGLQLAKMGLTRIQYFDDDVISVENMSNQFFMRKDIGKNKAHALADMVYEFTNPGTEGHKSPVFNPVRYTPDYALRLSGIVVAAVDSMAARQMIYDSIRESGANVDYIIDPRMSAEFYTQYVMNPFSKQDQATYAKVLQSDDESVAERCTAKSTVYTASLAAGMVTKTIKDIMLGNNYPRIINWDISKSANPMVMHEGNAGNVAAL